MASPDENKNTVESCWVRTAKYDMCVCCIKYSKSSEVPLHLKTLHRGLFGMVSLDQENRHLIETKHIHESNELHIWCRHNEQKMDAEKDKNYMLSSKAGEIVVRNASLCLRKGVQRNLYH